MPSNTPHSPYNQHTCAWRDDVAAPGLPGPARQYWRYHPGSGGVHEHCALEFKRGWNSCFVGVWCWWDTITHFAGVRKTGKTAVTLPARLCVMIVCGDSQSSVWLCSFVNSTLPVLLVLVWFGFLLRLTRIVCGRSSVSYNQLRGHRTCKDPERSWGGICLCRCVSCLVGIEKRILCWLRTNTQASRLTRNQIIAVECIIYLITHNT